MKTRKTVLPIFFIALFSQTACSKETLGRATSVGSDEDNVNVVFENGATAANITEYEALIAVSPPLITEENAFELTFSSDEGPTVSVGKFKIKIYVSSEYMAGCINQWAPHLVLEVTNERTTITLVELHLAGWFKSRTPCIGVINKSVIAYGFCLKGCFDNPKIGMKTSVKNSLIAAGVSGSVAAILAALTAPVAVAALGI